MFSELIIAVAIGILAGTVTGLIPGLHINLINTITILLPFPPLHLITFIIAMSITHTFTDVLPSIYLGAPDASHALSALPGHKLLLEGRGHHAILATLVGSTGSLILSLILFPIFILVLKVLVVPTPYILIAVLLYFLYKDKFVPAPILLVSGLFGFLVLQYPNAQQPLLPMLSGMFGISTLLLSQKGVVPTQYLTHTNVPVSAPALLASVLGFFAAFLPGVGASQVSIIAAHIARKAEPIVFLAINGGINTAGMLISLATAYVLSKARNGSVVAILSLAESLSFHVLLLLLSVALVVAGVAVLFTIQLSHIFAKVLPMLPYGAVVILICSAITLAVFYFDGIFGILVLGVSTALGVYVQIRNISRHYLLGCLIIPVIVFLL